MKNREKILQEEMRKLIKKSCNAQPQPGSEYRTFQKTLLKFFFNAADVSLDYDKQIITIWTSNTTKRPEDKLYEMSDVLSVKVSYNNLEETLKGCLEDGKNQSRFYQSLLFHYNHVEEEVNSDAISA